MSNIVKKEEDKITLFEFNNPSEMVQLAKSVSTILSSVIEDNELYVNIQGNKHVCVEGWTTLGFMVGVFATIDYTNKIERKGEGKRRPPIVYEARAVAKRADGTIIGSADAMCSSYERNWNNKDEYAIRSMAQTRAISKALRIPLGWIMHLSGYNATPAEEMTFAKAESLKKTNKGKAKDDAEIVHDALNPKNPKEQQKIKTEKPVTPKKKEFTTTAEEYVETLYDNKGNDIDAMRQQYKEDKEEYLVGLLLNKQINSLLDDLALEIMQG